jgi:hypothetical protein
MSRGIPYFLAGLALVGLPTVADAQDRKAQYRHLTLADGRQMTAEILSTEPIGLRLRSPLGESVVSFELLVDMVPATRADYEAQSNVRVYVAAPLEHQEHLAEAFGWLEGVDTKFVGASMPGLSADQVSRASACGSDFSCLLDVTAAATEWMYVASITSTEAGDLKLLVSPTRGATVVKSEQPDTREGRWSLVHEMVMVKVPEGGPPRVPKKPSKSEREGRSPSTMTDNQWVSASFVPLPGYPSFKQGDAGGGLVALGIAIPTSALLVGAAGHGGQSVPQTALVAGIGTYTATVIANSIGGQLSKKRR